MQYPATSGIDNYWKQKNPTSICAGANPLKCSFEYHLEFIFSLFYRAYHGAQFFFISTG
jgi:hypothetical protein